MYVPPLEKAVLLNFANAWADGGAAAGSPQSPGGSTLLACTLLESRSARGMYVVLRMNLPALAMETSCGPRTSCLCRARPEEVRIRRPQVRHDRREPTREQPAGVDIYWVKVGLVYAVALAELHTAALLACVAKVERYWVPRAYIHEEVRS